MTTLQAVNEILEWVGQPAVTALDTSGNSDATEAENTLSRVNYEIQELGWAVNTTLDRTLYYPTIKITVGAPAAGTFTYLEGVTEAVTLAVGRFVLFESTFLYLAPYSGTFTGGRLLTGSQSGATKTGSTYANITTTGYKIAFPSSYLSVVPSLTGGETAKFVMRGASLWDVENETYVFTRNVRADVVELLAFTDIATPRLARYIAKAAAAQYFAFKLRGTTLPGFRQAELARARVHALQEDADLRKTDLTKTADAAAARGYRSRGPIFPQQ